MEDKEESFSGKPQIQKKTGRMLKVNCISSIVVLMTHTKVIILVNHL